MNQDELIIVFRFVTTASAALFAGAALYVTIVEHPARVSARVSTALREFRPSYRRATALQVAMALTSCLCSLAVWVFIKVWPWLLGGGLVGASIPLHCSL